LNAAESVGGKVFFPSGIYKISNIIVRSDIDSVEGAILKVYNTGGVGVIIGDGPEGANNLTIHLPQVLQSVQEWDGTVASGVAPTIVTDTGVKITHLRRSRLHCRMVKNFSRGFAIEPSGDQSVAYNEIHLGQSFNNAIGLTIRPSGSAWANENWFYGGQFAINSNEHPPGNSQAIGTRHIAIYDGGVSTPNNNSFFGASLEGRVPEFNIYCEGILNTWYSPRLESAGEAPRIWWNNGANRNIINNGYSVGNATILESGGGYANIINTPNNSTGDMKWAADGVNGYLTLQYTGGDYPVLSILPYTGGNINSSVRSTDYSWQFKSWDFDGKQRTDANPRLHLEADTGRIYFGDGVYDPVVSGAYISRIGDALSIINLAGNGTIQFTGDTIPSVSSVYNLGTSAKRWLNVNADNVYAETLCGSLNVAYLTDIDGDEGEALVSDGAGALIFGIGRHYGGISVSGNAVATPIDSADTWYHFKEFHTNNPSKEVTPDFTKNHLIVLHSGDYMCTVSTCFEGSANDEIQLMVFSNSGAFEYGNVHGHRKLGTTGDIGSMTLHGAINCTAGDEIELWVRNDTSAQNITIQDCTMTLDRLS
jgi:hypothetical protein